MKSRILVLAPLVLLSVLALPADSYAQRGRWRNNSGWSKKCEKFVNCHDARDGRWDNRGPRRRSSWNRFYSPNNRYRVYDNSRYRRVNRQWHRN